MTAVTLLGRFDMIVRFTCRVETIVATAACPGRIGMIKTSYTPGTYFMAGITLRRCIDMCLGLSGSLYAIVTS
jgi:hypothetical protein